MGQAKYRKIHDPLYGRVPQTINDRGLIVSSPMSLNLDNGSMHLGGGLDPMELRFSLLYWDKLMFPASPTIYIDGGDDCNFLTQVGVMTRPVYGIGSGIGANILWSTFVNAFVDCESKEPGVWSLSQGEKSLYLQNSANMFTSNNGISVNLIRAIPTPKADVPLAEILEFKEKRREELMIFRAHIDKITKLIQESNDRMDEFNKTIKDIDSSCADLLKVGREWQYPIHISDFKASINLNGFKTATAVGGGWKLGEPYGLTAAGAVAAIAGGISVLDINADMGLRSIRRPSSPYRYVLKAHQELV